MASRIIFTKMTIEQPFELMIYDTDAITKLQEILQREDSDTANNFNIYCISSPTYKIVVSDYTVDACNNTINNCFEMLKLKASKYKSSICLKPRRGVDGKNDVNGIVKQQDIYIRRVNMLQNQNMV
jgi:translation initiation factor 2 alpha subunit (eIF-2alpha)